MTTNFRVKIGKIGLFTFILSPGIPKYHHSDFQKFICDDLATSCDNFVNIGEIGLAYLTKILLWSSNCGV